MNPPLFRRILCAIDFSETSRHALHHAVALARWSHSHLTVLHVCKPFVIALMELPNERAMRETRARVQEELDACGGPPADGGAEIAVEIDDAATSILQRAASDRADLIVVGTHGLSGFERLLLGSVAEKVLRKADCPVMTVPPRAPDHVGLPFRRILAAIDFSPCSLEAARLASVLATDAGAEVMMVHAIQWPWGEPPSPALDELPPQQAEALREYRRYVTASAEAQLTQVAGDSAAPTSVGVSHGRPHAEILRAAVEWRADLIVLGINGRSAADVMVFGSTANQVVRQAACPVLTFRHSLTSTSDLAAETGR